MGDLDAGALINQIVENPAGEHRGFHSGDPRLLQVRQPFVQCLTSSRYGALSDNGSVSLTDTEADCLLVNVKSQVAQSPSFPAAQARCSAAVIS